MSRKEFEIFSSILDDMETSDDKIEVLERLYFVVKNMVNEYENRNVQIFHPLKHPSEARNVR